MRLILLILLGFLSITAAQAHLTSFNQPNHKMMSDTLLDLSTMETSPHELALTQVLSEICPKYLNASQKRRFQESYQKQLKILIPEFDPTLVMQQINQSHEYRMTLRGVRAWTMSYPSEENKALCVEFAETPIY